MFSTKTEIEQLFSQVGVTLRLDDTADADASTDVVAQIIDDATGIMLTYLWDQYEVATLAASAWVRTRATYISAYLLSMRRGNDAQFVDRYSRILEELQLIYNRQLKIPMMNVLTTTQPTLANYMIDNRSFGPAVRVTADSVGTYPGQRTAANYPLPEII